MTRRPAGAACARTPHLVLFMGHPPCSGGTELGSCVEECAPSPQEAGVCRAVSWRQRTHRVTCVMSWGR